MNDSHHSHRLTPAVLAVSARKMRAVRARARTAFIAAIALLVVGGLLLARDGVAPSAQAVQAAAEPASAQEAAQASQAAPQDTGRRDFQWTADNLSAPTAEKNQSKLWFNDGSWWGILFNNTASPDQYRIYKFDTSTRTWSDTAIQVDTRNTSHPDALWDGTHLYVASGVHASLPGSSEDIRVYRYSYDTNNDTYSLDAGFPVVIGSGPVEAVVLTRDSTGQLWATYTQNDTVYVNSSQAGDATWGTSFTPQVSGTSVMSDDISSIMAYGGKVGLMWSNQADPAHDRFYFAVHNDADADNVWQPSIIVSDGPQYADDHIHLTTLQEDQGADSKLYAVVKSNCNEAPGCRGDGISYAQDALIWLFVIGSTEVQSYTVSRGMDNWTRPISVIDSENRNLYLFGTASTNGVPIGEDPETGIYYKSTSLDSITFVEGQGTEFIRTTTDTHINDATSTKQNVNGTTGLLVEAADSATQYYLHNYLDIAGLSECSIQFQDVPSDYTFYPFVRCLACKGILGGYQCGEAGEPCGTTGNPYFRPSVQISRGQIAKIVAQSANLNDEPGQRIFEDVPEDSPFFLYIQQLTNRAYMGGYPCGQVATEACVAPANRPYFRPGSNATRGQLSKIVANAAQIETPASGQTYEDVPGDSPFYQFIERLTVLGVMSGYPCGDPGELCGSQNKPYFRPNANVTRGQAAKIVSNTFFPNCQTSASR